MVAVAVNCRDRNFFLNVSDANAVEYGSALGDCVLLCGEGVVENVTNLTTKGTLRSGGRQLSDGNSPRPILSVRARLDKKKRIYEQESGAADVNFAKINVSGLAIQAPKPLWRNYLLPSSTTQVA
ncbi:hypothetical protein LTR66_015965, partial [Elasticomyces elasticus]